MRGNMNLLGVWCKCGCASLREGQMADGSSVFLIPAFNPRLDDLMTLRRLFRHSDSLHAWKDLHLAKYAYFISHNAMKLSILYVPNKLTLTV